MNIQTKATRILHHTGRSYLHDVLCPVLSDVLNKSRHSAEIDPELVEANSVVVQKFPDEPNARYTAISSFLFLRFFNPAILSPKQFGLADDYTDERVSRTLKLISKTIQNIANGVEFAEKEMYMRPLNALIKLHIPFVRRYIDRIALPPENRSKYIQRNLSFRAAEDTRKSKTYKSKKCPTCRNNTPKAQLNLEKDVASLTRRFNTLRQTLGGSSGSGSKTSSTPSAPTAKTRQKGKLSNTSSQASKHSSTSTTSAGESREQLCGKDGSETTSMSALLAMRTASTESFSIKGLLGNILGAVSKSEGDLCSAGETSDADSSSKYEHSETSKRFTGKESTDDGVLTQLQTGSKATDKTGSLDDVFKVPDSVGMKVGKPARAATCTTLKPAPLLKHRAQSGIALTSGMGRTISPTVKENCISMSLGRSEGLRVQQQGSSQRLGMTPNDKRGSIPERLDLVLNNLQQAAVLLQNQSRRRGAKF
ncbi:hypothetical protein SARC_05052 [Sphaeroforma arctica JP610]|uniref:Ras-GAP domain-containing protein n=1 Tax=Sphaeroforma arctica JP610 TaxID=667725 RepID=A0A0L0G0T6_9EUKA|nr:hypothetical protein SARC_05052 [Sphaeroforma arctica JP610]KNC82675.1 hypothetical protein SARC_05052 [Sphaeroforma arctica JP610]|eukprot:XP_014156577.1 hypothetical protein SARC_05052 [Sphaeroforma arctica JP610]